MGWSDKVEKSWADKVIEMGNPTSIRFAMAVGAFNDHYLEWDVRRAMIAEALSIPEGAVDEAIADMIRVGLATKKTVPSWLRPFARSASQ